MRLSTAKIQNATAQKKTVRLFDGRGLYLEIAPTGSRWWRFKYRFPEHYVFPGARSRERCMSENTVNGALRRLGWSGSEMTGHGFRSMASTLLNEQGWNRDAIERQLAHTERNSIRATYNYAEHLPERRRMMQAWSDYLDTLKRRPEAGAREAA